MNLDDFALSDEDMKQHHDALQEEKKGSRRPTVRTVGPIPLPMHRKGELFIMGPIPMARIQVASPCGARAVAVALLLWYSAFRSRSNPVKLTKSILAELGVHPKTARQVLIKMEDKGLVTVDRHTGRSPIVTITRPDPLKEQAVD